MLATFSSAHIAAISVARTARGSYSATVEYPGQGYTGLLGWIQLVCSSDNASHGQRFEMDPLEILGEVGHPFCFFGIKPTLFDAPARDSRADMTHAN